MSEFVMVAWEDEVPEGGKALFEAGGTTVLVARVEGRFYATQPKCMHLGGPLVRGTLKGATLICPWHGTKYDVTTGKVLEGPFNEDFRKAHPMLANARIVLPKRVKGDLTTYEVKVQDGNIMVAVP